MHEFSLVTEIYRACRATIEQHGAGRLEEARLAVGELSAVEPDLLTFAWEAVTHGTPDEGSRLVVEWRPVKQLCGRCGEVAERAQGSWLRLCPRCEGPLTLEGGQELDILDITFTRDGEPEAGGAE